MFKYPLILTLIKMSVDSHFSIKFRIKLKNYNLFMIYQKFKIIIYKMAENFLKKKTNNLFNKETNTKVWKFYLTVNISFFIQQMGQIFHTNLIHFLILGFLIR